MCVRRVKAVRIVPKAAISSTIENNSQLIGPSMTDSISNESLGHGIEDSGSAAEELSMWNIDMELFPAMSLDIR